MREAAQKIDKSQAERSVIWEMTVRRIQKHNTDTEFRLWLGTLSLAMLSETKAQVICRGEGLHPESWEHMVEENLRWAAGRKLQVDFKQESVKIQEQESKKKQKENEKKEHSAAKEKKKNKSTKRNFAAAAGIAVLLIILLAGGIYLQNRRISETFYQIGNAKLGESFRIIQLSDLSGDTYDRDGNEELLRRTEQLKPDLIVITGDMVGKNRENQAMIQQMCGRLAKLAPVYYVYGEQEGDRFIDDSDELRINLEAAGVCVLWDEMDSIEIKGNKVDLFGFLSQRETESAIDGYEVFLSTNPNHLKILLSHSPYGLDELESWPDIIFSGHTMGGWMRVPYLGAIWDGQYGLFPERQDTYIGGRYTTGVQQLIVSRGLGRKGGLRLNNPPELVIADLVRY